MLWIQTHIVILWPAEIKEIHIMFTSWNFYLFLNKNK